ncbi:MAG: hypothetical protein NTZ50_09835 [Chloroflexi bacterium]|nr:hypothetical protein [Chloroflexota bacterium]
MKRKMRSGRWRTTWTSVNKWPGGQDGQCGGDGDHCDAEGAGCEQSDAFTARARRFDVNRGVAGGMCVMTHFSQQPLEHGIQSWKHDREGMRST